MGDEYTKQTLPKNERIHVSLKHNQNHFHYQNKFCICFAKIKMFVRSILGGRQSVFSSFVSWPFSRDYRSRHPQVPPVFERELTQPLPSSCYFHRNRHNCRPQTSFVLQNTVPDVYIWGRHFLLRSLASHLLVLRK